MNFRNFIYAALIVSTGCESVKSILSEKPQPKFCLQRYPQGCECPDDPYKNRIGIALNCRDWKNYKLIAFADDNFDGTLDLVSYVRDESIVTIEKDQTGFDDFKFLYEDAKHDLMAQARKREP